MIPTYASSLPGQSETVEMHRSLRLWAFSFVVIAAISMYGEDAWDFAWGVVIIIALLITLKFKSPAMFIVFGVIMGWSALLNVLSVLFGEGMDKLWYGVGLVQAIWTAFDIRQYQKYRHLIVENEPALAGRITRGIAILSFVLVIFAGNMCVGEIENLEQPMNNTSFMAMMTAMDFTTLTLGLSLAVTLHAKRPAEEVKAWLVMSAVVLAGFMVLMILGGILSIAPQAGS